MAAETNRVCSKCGKSKPADTSAFSRRGSGLMGWCKECDKRVQAVIRARRATKRKRSPNSPERILAMKRWRKANTGHVSEYRRQYYENNKEMRKADARRRGHARWASLTPEQRKAIKLKKAIGRLRQSGVDAAREARWRAKHPDKTKSYRERYLSVPENKDTVRRAIAKWKDSNRDRLNAAGQRRRANAPTAISVVSWRSMKQFYEATCLKCGRREPEIKLTQDHVRPLVKGGAHVIQNIQPLCISCNSTKFTSTIDYRLGAELMSYWFELGGV